MSGKRVLVVDDDPAIRELLGLILESESHDVARAANGAEALRQVATTPPDLILLDLKMDVMDGFEFTRRYREMMPPHAPIIVITAAARAEEIRDLKACAYLSKPFDLQDLLDAVEACSAAGASSGRPARRRLVGPL